MNRKSKAGHVWAVVAAICLAWAWQFGVSVKATSRPDTDASPVYSLTTVISNTTVLERDMGPGVTLIHGIPDPATLKKPSMPRATPTPAATPAAKPSPTPAHVQTLDELQTKIRQRIFAPEVRRGRIGIKIVSLNSGKVIFENDSDKYFIPASNMKNFTIATALERLGPDFRFVTSVLADSKPDQSGTIKGSLVIFGRGDVSISTAFNNGDYYKGLDNLADKIVAAGVKRIEGSIVADERYFKGSAIPGTWEWDDLQWYYGAEVSALPLNDNAVDLAVSPGAVGSPCAVKVSPENALMRVVNLCTTTPANAKRDLSVVKQLDRNVLEINGSMPTGDKAFTGSVAFTHPAELFVVLLTQRLKLKGVTITGEALTLPLNSKTDAPRIEIARLESPPFSVIAAKTLKPSQNMYTETILWTLGESLRKQISKDDGQPKDDDPQGPERKRLLRLNSSELGLSAIRNLLGNIGVADDGILQYDGSGLSRHDLITPSAVVTLYTYMARQSKYAQVWRDSLSIGGVDGTLSKRFVGTAAAGNIRGKTGTIDQVAALSGYMTSAGGEPLVLSIVVNGVAEPRQRTSLIDDIVISLANFNGKVDQ